MKFPIMKDISLEVVSLLCVCIGYRILKEGAICVGDSLISRTNIEQNVDVYVRKQIMNVALGYRNKSL